MTDKFSAVWLSHSSISDFQKCPRLYFLNNVYRDPRTGHKISLTSPALSLGSAVHATLEALSSLPVKERFTTSLFDRFQIIWANYQGKKGGFTTGDEEAHYRERAVKMLARVDMHRGPLERLAVKINSDLPQYWLSEEEGLMLCGKLDWLEYLEVENAVHIIDFKTGIKDEPVESLQLPIYYLLAHNCQDRPVAKASYWYLDRQNVPVSQPLPSLESAEAMVLKLGKEIKLARALNRFKCPEGEGGCKYCQPLESVVKGQAEFVGTSAYNQDLYLLSHTGSTVSQIL